MSGGQTQNPARGNADERTAETRPAAGGERVAPLTRDEADTVRFPGGKRAEYLVAFNGDGPAGQTPERKQPAPEYPANVRILSATRQNELAEIGSNTVTMTIDGKQRDIKLSVYTDRLFASFAHFKRTDSLEAAHESATKAAKDGKEKALPVASAAERPAVWTRSEKVDPDRAAIVIRGGYVYAPGTEFHEDELTFHADSNLIYNLASEQLGVDPKAKGKLQGLAETSITEIEDAIKAAAASGAKDLLIYYTGHGAVDANGVSLRNKDGQVTNADSNRHLSDQRKTRGTEAAEQGEDSGGLILHHKFEGQPHTVVLHEQRLQEMLRKHGANLRSITIIGDTDHFGAFLPDPTKK